MKYCIYIKGTDELVGEISQEELGVLKSMFAITTNIKKFKPEIKTIIEISNSNDCVDKKIDDIGGIIETIVISEIRSNKIKESL